MREKRAQPAAGVPVRRAGSLIGAAGGFFFGPIVAVVVAVILVVLVTILIDLLVNWIIGGLAFYWKHRKRFIAAPYA